jgi:NDP-sugar pyrophosphorylase family protein
MAPNRLRVSAAILAGGLGSRLRSVVADRPKVLAPVRGRPYITFLLDKLADASIEEVVLLTGFQAEQVRRVLGTTYAGMRLAYSEEPSPLGTAGAIRWALQKLSCPTLLVLNGDSHCAVNLPMFRAFHDERAAEVSLVLAKVASASRFGSVSVDVHCRVKRFDEKIDMAGSAWINAGIYLFQRRLIEALPMGRFLSLEHDLFPEWVESRRVYGFRSKGQFLDIGTPEAYATAASFLPVRTGSE